MPVLTSNTLPLASSSSSSNTTATPNLGKTSNITNASNNNNNKETDPEAHDISSPHELIGWVDSVLGKLETKFSRLEVDVLDRLDVLGKRIDSLETSMAELMDGAGGATSSGPSTAPLTAPLIEQPPPSGP